jgi:hypothetical protein
MITQKPKGARSNRYFELVSHAKFILAFLFERVRVKARARAS